MKIDLHPSACENYNKKIIEIKSQLRFKIPPDKISKPIENPNIHVSGYFDKTNIIGDIKPSWTDSNGNISGRAFNVRGRLLGLFDDDYRNLHRIAEGIQKSTNPKNIVSVNTISELIFQWIEQTYKGIKLPAMTQFVLSECEKKVEEAEIWIPISNLHLESPFVIGKITFKVITKKIMDDYEESSLLHCKNDEEIAKVKTYFDRKRSKIQNLAVAILKIEAEPKHAHSIVLEETERAMSVLRFFSPNNLFPTRICYAAPIEKQFVDGDFFLTIKDGKVVGEFSGITDSTYSHWVLRKAELQEYFKTGLNVLSNLLTKENLTDFQQKLLESLFLYSKASMAKQLEDRLMYTLIALETVFVKDTSEPLQDNISLRMAQMHPISVQERQKIISNIKETYAIRSGFVHHGKSLSADNLDVLKLFMWNTWMSLQGLIQLAEQGISRKDFFDWLEERRIGG